MAMGGQRQRVSPYPQLLEDCYTIQELVDGDNRLSKLVGERTMPLSEYQERGMATKDCIMAGIAHKHELIAFQAGPDHVKVLLWFERVGNGQAYRSLISYLKFNDAFSAKKFIEEATEGYDIKWISPTELRVRDWFNIRTDKLSKLTLEDVMEYEYKKGEKDYKLNIPYSGYARYIHGYHWGSHPDVNQHARAANGLKPLSEEDRIKMGGTPRPEQPSGAVTERKRPEQERKPRASKDGMIQLADVCKELGIEPSHARAALRDAKVPKPEGGWVWKSKEDVPDIKKLVDKRRKK
jgi:hypothetical protein